MIVGPAIASVDIARERRISMTFMQSRNFDSSCVIAMTDSVARYASTYCAKDAGQRDRSAP